MKSFKNPLKYAGLSITLFVLLAGNCFGQSITWQRVFNNDYGSIKKVQQTADGGYVGVGSDYINNVYKIYFTKLDKYGNTLWTKIIGTGYSYGNWVEETNDNGFIIGGSSDSAVGNLKLYLVKTDSLGNIQWQRYYSYSSLDQGNCVKQTIDNGFIIVGRTTLLGYSSLILIKVDNIGIVQWNKIINFGVGVSIQNLLILEQGYLLTGWINNNPSDALIIKTNYDGDTLWSKTFGGTNTDAAYSSELLGNFGYLIGGNSNSYNTHSESYLLKLDTSGNLIWQRTYSGTYGEECYSIKYRPGIGYVMAGYSDTDNFLFARAMVKIIDTSGNVIRQKTFFPSSRGGWFNDIELTMDGGYILGGAANNNSFIKMYLAKTDSLLEAEPIGITNNNNNSPSDFQVSQNYPNPFNPNTSIRLSLKKSSYVKINIYDLSGKLLKEVINRYLFAGYHNVDINFEDLNISSGVYFYSAFIDNSFQPISTYKMIYLK